jgi:predicted porin
MKKTLLASTAALALAVIPGAASAQVEVTIGGYYDFEFGAGSNDDAVLANEFGVADGDDIDEFGFRTDAEIHFDVRGTTDNGLNFGVEVEMEASDQNEGDIDETWLFISGDPWGEFRGGFTDGPTGDGNIAAPTVTPIVINDGTQAAFIIVPSVGTTDDVITGNNASFDTGVVAADGDALKAIYYTPRFSGVQFGVSYAPDPTNGADNDDRVANRDDTYSNEIQVALNYEGSFQAVDVLAGFTYTYAEAPEGLAAGDPASEDLNAIHFGVNLGWGGFEFGGGYGQILDGGVIGGGDFDGDGVNDVSRESWGFDVGASYGQGPWAVSVTYFYGEADGADQVATINEEAEHQSVLVGGSYQLGAGLEAYAGVGYSEYEGQMPGTDLDENDGVFGFTGVTVSF